MNNKVFISCAVTGSGDTAIDPDLPKTPEQIAKASIEAAKAGAAIAHIHVREEDGKPSRRLELYKEVVDRIRSSDTDVVLNLTTGMGGDLDVGQEKTLRFQSGDRYGKCDGKNYRRRTICQRFVPWLWNFEFGDSSVITVNTPNDLRKAAKRLQEINVKPEIEADLEICGLALNYIKKVIKWSTNVSNVFRYSVGSTSNTFGYTSYERYNAKEGIWSGFAISKNEMPFVAQTVIMGGNPRVGLEDNLYLEKGKLATNGGDWKGN